MATNYPLTIEDFKAWLESKEGLDTVGTTQIDDCCPITNALKEIVYKDIDYLSVEYRFTRVCGILYGNPIWVEDFTRKIDNLSKEPVEVTVKQALDTLSRVEKTL